MILQQTSASVALNVQQSGIDQIQNAVMVVNTCLSPLKASF